jgi:hypothetical protein
MEKVRGRTTGPVRTYSSMTDETEMEKSFWISRSDRWVVNRKMKKTILLETLRIFGIGKEDGKRIINRLGHTLLNEHEKIFGSYW